jgi:DNA-binding XRE family transcriptional regulator
MELCKEVAMDDHASFGYWVRRRRKALDLTQDALAQQVGCSVMTIRKIEGDISSLTSARPSSKRRGLNCGSTACHDLSTWRTTRQAALLWHWTFATSELGMPDGRTRPRVHCQPEP